MDSRRSLLRTVTGLVAGGTALLAGVGSAAARRIGDERRSTTANAHANSAGATTIAVDANRTAIRSARQPATLAPPIRDLERRFDAVSLADVASVTGAGRVAGGNVVAGTLTASGSFAADSLRSELRRGGFTAVEGQNGVDRYATGENPFAVGVADSRLVLEYGRSERPRAPLGASNSARGSGSAGFAVPALKSVLDGDLIATATLDAGTRDRLRAALEDGLEPLATVLERAAAIGASVAVDADGRSGVTYGLIGGENGIAVETVRNALEGVGRGADGIGSVRVGRRGRAVVVEADVATAALFEAQFGALGFDGPVDARSVVGR